MVTPSPQVPATGDGDIMEFDRLKALYTLNIKAVEGYRQAAAFATNDVLTEALLSFSTVHEQYAQALAAQFEAMDYEVETSGLLNLAGELHQVWMDFKQSVDPANNLAIIEECLRGESRTLAEYEEAMGLEAAHDDALITLLTSQHEGVVQLHEKLEQIKATYEHRA